MNISHDFVWVSSLVSYFSGEQKVDIPNQHFAFCA